MSLDADTGEKRQHIFNGLLLMTILFLVPVFTKRDFSPGELRDTLVPPLPVRPFALSRASHHFDIHLSVCSYTKGHPALRPIHLTHASLHLYIRTGYIVRIRLA